MASGYWRIGVTRPLAFASTAVVRAVREARASSLPVALSHGGVDTRLVLSERRVILRSVRATVHATAIIPNRRRAVGAVLRRRG